MVVRYGENAHLTRANPTALNGGAYLSILSRAEDRRTRIAPLYRRMRILQVGLRSNASVTCRRSRLVDDLYDKVGACGPPGECVQTMGELSSLRRELAGLAQGPRYEGPPCNLVQDVGQDLRWTTVHDGGKGCDPELGHHRVGVHLRDIGYVALEVAKKLVWRF